MIRQRAINDTDVYADCPACGNPTLYLGEGGYITCFLMDCPDPEVAIRLLDLPGPVLMTLLTEGTGL